MAARTGIGISPCLGVRLPKQVFDTIHAAARLHGTTAAALARECLCSAFGQIRADVGLSLDLNQRIAALGRGEEFEA